MSSWIKRIKLLLRTTVAWWPWVSQKPPSILRDTPAHHEPPPTEVRVKVPAEPRKPRGLPISKTRERIANNINDILDKFRSLRRNTIDDHWGGRDMRNCLGFFAKSDLFLLGSDAPQTEGGSEWIAFNPYGIESEVAEAVWPIDTATCHRRDDGSWQLMRVVTADPKLMRGRVKILPQKIAWVVQLDLTDDGKWWADKIPVGLLGNRWIALDEGMTSISSNSLSGTMKKHRATSQKIKEETHSTVSMATSIALSERYWWHVALGTHENMPRLMIPTNPAGCLELFKNRRKGDAEQRRPALRHWVHNHFREGGQVGLTFVRSHIRGATDFEWYDLNCELLVSQFDLEKNEEFKEEAAQWRSKRKHNHVRVRLKQ